MPHVIPYIPGDSVGGELGLSVQRILRTFGFDLLLKTVDPPKAAQPSEEIDLSRYVEAIENSPYCLKGRLERPSRGDGPDPNAELRRRAGLFATVVPIFNHYDIPCRHQNVDLIIVRESSEGLYVGEEDRLNADLVTTLKVVTRQASRRVVDFAFHLAKQEGRRKVTLVHKANIMKLTDGLFLEEGRRVAQKHPDVELQTLIADNAAMQLLKDPKSFDVVVTGNLFGATLSDLAAGLVGGISNTAAYATDGSHSLYEALHGIAPELEGKGAANPLPLLTPVYLLAKRLGFTERAQDLREAVRRAVAQGQVTPDLGGTATTRTMIDAILALA